MKQLFIILFISCILCGLTFGQTVTVNLQWDANAPEEGVKGYKVYQKVITPAPPTFPNAPDAITWNLVGQTLTPVTNIIIKNVSPGTQVFTVTAFNDVGESGRSEPVVTNYLNSPKGLKATVTLTVEVPK